MSAVQEQDPNYQAEEQEEEEEREEDQVLEQVEPPEWERPFLMLHPDTGKQLLIDPITSKQVVLKPCADYKLECSFVGNMPRGYTLSSLSKQTNITPYWAHMLFASARGKEILHPKILETVEQTRCLNPDYQPQETIPEDTRVSDQEEEEEKEKPEEGVDGKGEQGASEEVKQTDPAQGPPEELPTE